MLASHRTWRFAMYQQGAGRVQPPLCGAVPGVPLHRLERAAQSAARAHGARGAGPARHRRDGASRVGLHRPARLQGLRGDGPIVGPDRHHSVRVRREGRLVTIDVRADAFLRGMVRAWWPSSWRSASARWMRQRSGRHSPVPVRPSTGRPPRPRG